MKTLQIQNTREIFFTNSKEQYLYFKKVWSQAVNSESAKRKLEYSDFFGCKVRQAGWLTSTHHLLYALIRGRDAFQAFTPVTNHNKLTNGAYLNWGLHMARYNLKYVAGRAREYIENGTETKRWLGKTIKHDNSYLEKFLAPFEGTITPQMLIKLDELCPKVEPIESGYGKGKQVAKDIVAGKITSISYAELMECLA